jgi:hypothetical protein
MSNQKEPNGAVTPSSEPKPNVQTQDKRPINYKPNTFNLPFYKTMEHVKPEEFINLEDLINLIKSPSIGDKINAAALTPFEAKGKKKQDAINALYHAIVVDHDDDDLTFEQLSAKYDPHNVNYIAFTTSYHQQDKEGFIGNRWKVIIPLAAPVGHETFYTASLGIALLMGADKSQARVQQVFFAPNKLSEHAPYDYVIKLDGETFNVENKECTLNMSASQAYKSHEKELHKKATQAPAKTKNSITNNNNIIDLINDAYDLVNVIESKGYKRIGSKHLSPHSSSGVAGVVILTDDNGKQRIYSHHGESDPLSSLNHDGHALDTFDVLCCLIHSGDVSAAIKHYANELDQEGQKERQRVHMEQKDSVTVDNFEKLEAEAKKGSGNLFALPDYPDELLNLPYQLGKLQAFIFKRMAYPSIATAGITALSTLTAFAQTNITVKSRDGLGLNEYYMVLAPTGFGKEDLRKPAEILNKKANEIVLSNDLDGRLINGSSVRFCYSAPASTQGIHQILEDNRSVFFLSDEFAEWLRLSHKDSTKQAALGYLMQAYSKALSVIEPGHAVTKQYVPVKNPRLSILATSTAEAMFETMTREQADSGAYNRWIMFVGEQELPQKLYDGLVYEPENELVEFIAWVKTQTKESVVKFDNESFAEYKNLDQELAEPIKRKDALLGGRLGEQSIKIAALLALSDKRFVMSPNDIKTAFNIRIGLYRRAAALTVYEGNMEGLHSTGQALKQVSAIFEKSPLVYKSQLGTKSRKYSKLSLPEQKAVIDALISQGIASQCAQSKAVLVSHICKGE